jgi:hypothetical protein
LEETLRQDWIIMNKLRLLLLLAIVGSTLVFPSLVSGQGIRPQVLAQQAKLTTSAGTAATAFGTRVSVNGNYAIVSNQGEADANNPNLTNKGAAYIFNRSGSGWTQQARLVDPNGVAGDQFGYGATDGTYAVVGATRANNEKGKLTFWKRNAVFWSYQMTLTGSDTVDQDRLGFKNVISGNTVATGVVKQNNNRGAVYVFTRTVETWAQQAKIVPNPNDLQVGDQFGFALALDGDTLVVGAPGRTSAPPYGAVYIFVRSGTTWTQQAKLTELDLPDPNSQFGLSVGLSGDRLIVGTNLIGRAYIYTRTGTTWAKDATLTPLLNYSNGFGSPVDIRGTRAVVGDRNCGCLTVLVYNGTTWTQQQQLKPSEAVSTNFPLVLSMSVTGSYIVASNGGDPGEAPQVFVFDPLTAGARQDSVGIYRNGTFYLRYTNSGGAPDFSVAFGGDPSDLPIAGDWNGDGIDTIGVYRSNAGLYLLSDSNTSPAVNYQFTFGNPGDTPLAGKWSVSMIRDGTGVYRNSNGILYLREALSTGFSDYDMVLGNPGDRGVAGDWDGNGIDTVGVYRPSQIRFYLSNANGHGITFSDVTNDFGTSATDQPVAGNWAGYYQSGIGVFTSDGKFSLKLDPTLAGPADIEFFYGVGTDLPVVGRWINPSVPPPPVTSGKPTLGDVVVRGTGSPAPNNANSGGAD